MDQMQARRQKILHDLDLTNIIKEDKEIVLKPPSIVEKAKKINDKKENDLIHLFYARIF
jgi:hypothetical protein